ncbi:MAG: ABC transporter substrate-binding protein [Lachnospiraceae bacterium]|nr:ABC transporter substrate-binding protein [Lachnospiraceae bacterium]
MKKISLLFVAILCVAFFTACGTDIKTTATSDGTETKIVKHMKGETEVPTNPIRIVDISGSAEELDILGISYIASANTSMFDGITIPEHLEEEFKEKNIEIVGNWSGMTDINIEKIVELEPDLIIMNAHSEKIYDQLNKIAPTLMLTDDYTYIKWRERFLELGEWFDKRETAENWLKDYDSKAEELSNQVKEVIGDETVAVLEKNTVYLGSYYIYGTAGPGGIAFTDLNLNHTAITPTDKWAEVIDLESLAKVDADHIIFTSNDGTLGELEENPVWNNLKAVKEGNVYLGTNELQYNMSYTSLGKSMYMEKLAKALINHTDID